jgi:long-chain acyl-CoA synthetase
MAANAWSGTVERAVVRGRSCLVHAHRRSNLAELLDDASRWRDREFIVQGPTRLTVADFRAEVERASGVLAGAGVRPGDRVMLLAANSPDWVAGFFAITWCGAVITCGNSWWSRAETAEACAASGPRLVLADRRRIDLLPPGQAYVDIAQLTAGPVLPVPQRASPQEDAAAIVMFTSGTTGSAKAAVLSHRSVIANQQNLLAVTRRLLPDLPDDHRGSVALVSVPLFHTGGIQSILSTLLTGGTLVFVEGRFDPAAVLETIERERVRVWGGVPTMVTRVLDHSDRAERDLSSLATVTIAGTYVAADLLERVRTAFPSARRSAGTIYGMTEAGGTLTAAAGAAMEKRPGTVGRPLPTVELRIASADENGVGEIQAMSPALMDGYLRDDVEQPFTDDGWLQTGDLGRIDSGGYLFVVGRSKDVIIRGGENIACPNVERVLRSHPDVRDAAVVGLPDPEFGEIVAAAVVLDHGAAVTRSALHDFAAGHLAYFEVPSRWWFTSELPANATGKVMKRKIVDAWPGPAY